MKIPSNDPLLRAEAAATELRDIARAEARLDPDHDSCIATGRHEPIPQIVIQNYPSPSRPEIELPKQQSHWVKLAVGAAVTAILAWLADRFQK